MTLPWSVIGANLRRIRHERDEKLVDVALRAQVSVSLLSQAERGVCALSVPTVVRVADALGVTMNDLMHDPAPVVDAVDVEAQWTAFLERT